MISATLRMIGLLLAFVSQGCCLLISSGSVQICTPSGSDRGHFEVAMWCDGFPGAGQELDANVCIERGSGASLTADSCRHSLRLIVGRRTDREPAPQPAILVLPLLWTVSTWTGGDDLSAARLDPTFPTCRPSDRGASPLGLPRPPPSAHTI